jgi:Icc-related predicted phosphoesterase
MKVQILSDLHLDFLQNKIYFNNRVVPRAETLIVAGDCYGHVHDDHEDVLGDTLLSKWKNVIVIPGNHEFYGSNIDDPWFGSKERVYKRKPHTLQYVNNKVIELEGHYFICSTLWSYIGFEQAVRIKTEMNDYYQISRFSIDFHNEVHRKNVLFLEEAIESIPKDKRCVIVTHHVPSFNFINKRWKSHPLNDAFSANLDVFMMKHEGKISHWIHGHSHDFLDTFESGMRVIRNPMGYPQERMCNMDLVISL